MVVINQEEMVCNEKIIRCQPLMSHILYLDSQLNIGASTSSPSPPTTTPKLIHFRVMGVITYGLEPIIHDIRMVPTELRRNILYNSNSRCSPGI